MKKDFKIINGVETEIKPVSIIDMANYHSYQTGLKQMSGRI